MASLQDQLAKFASAHKEEVTDTTPLARILAKITKTDAEAITPDTRLDALSLSSIDLIELAVRVETDLGIVPDPQAYLGFQTVGDVQAFIDAHS